MEALHAYIKSLPMADRDAFAARAGTTVGYLYKAISRGKSQGHKLGVELVVALTKASDGAVHCESLRPDVDWSWLRSTSPPPAPAPRPRRSRKSALSAES